MNTKPIFRPRRSSPEKMEFLDDNTRPRFLFESRQSPTSDPPQTNNHAAAKPFLILTISLSSLLLILSLFFLHSEPSKSLLLWLALSLLLGPFAPISLTGGDIRVGRGPIVDFPDDSPQSDEETRKRNPQKRPKPRRPDEFPADPTKSETLAIASVTARGPKKDEEEKERWEEKEWTEEEIEVLKKQLAKNPVGKPRRWEAIAEALQGRHKVESVIKKAKELGEKKLSDADSYSEFLRRRKPVDKRIIEENQEADNNGGSIWSSGEDIALLNALKAFPKDAPMRWEKIAAAVPGKSKAACMKRVSELKRDFRSSKSAAAES